MRAIWKAHGLSPHRWRQFKLSNDQLRRHLDLFIDAYKHSRRLKTLKGLTPTQFIWEGWQARPELFYEKPCHLTVGPYTWQQDPLGGDDSARDIEEMVVVRFG